MLSILFWPVFFVLIVLFFASIRIIKEYEKGLIFTLGKYGGTKNPGLRFIIPIVQTMEKVDVREKAVDVPSQEAITKDNIVCSINAVVYYKIRKNKAYKAIIEVNNVDHAMVQFAQTTMRNIVGQFELDELLSNRQEASDQIKDIVDVKSDSWWVEVLSVELKDINIPESLKRTIGKQAEAEREKRAKIISAEWEKQAAQNLVDAAKMLAGWKGALHLRTLQSMNDMAADKSNTVFWMVPVEILKWYWIDNDIKISDISQDMIENVMKQLQDKNQ